MPTGGVDEVNLKMASSQRLWITCTGCVRISLPI